MSGIINTGTIAKAIWPGVNKFWGQGYKSYPTEYTKIFSEESSDKSYEEDVLVSGFGLFANKTQGSGISYDGIKQGPVSRYTHVVYGLGFQVTREMLEDMQYNLAFKNARALGDSARTTQEILAANILNRAFDSNYLGADGLEMCSTAHVLAAGGTASNKIAVAADLSEASIEQMLIDIAGMTDDRGLQKMARAQKLVIPRQLQFEAARILKSSQQSGTANNDINAINALGLEIVVNHYLTDTDAWFLLTDVPDGLKCFNRRDVEFGQDNDFDTENAKFKCTFRKSWGWTDWRGIFGSPGA